MDMKIFTTFVAFRCRDEVKLHVSTEEGLRCMIM